MTNKFYNQYYFTGYATNSTTSTTTINYPDSTFIMSGVMYAPFESNYVYDLSWNYTQDTHGLREYMFANDTYNEVAEILIEMKDEPDQDFEDGLYGLCLELLYEKVRKEYEVNFFNEKLIPYTDLNKIIQEIIDIYHKRIAIQEEI